MGEIQQYLIFAFFAFVLIISLLFTKSIREIHTGDNPDTEEIVENKHGNYCKECGGTIKNNDKYCRNCGKKL